MEGFWKHQEDIHTYTHIYIIYIHILLPQQQRGQHLVATFQDHGDSSQVCHALEQTLH